MSLDEKITERLTQAGIATLINKTYVDDKNMVATLVPAGLRYIDGEARMIDECVEGDRSLPEDQVTAEFVRSIASSIYTGLVFTADCPSTNADNKLPVLDLKLWLESGVEGETIVRHQFYEKEMTSQLVIHKNSALGWSVKRATLVNEVKRRLYNTDSITPWSEKANMVSKLSVKMLKSGYNSSEIFTVVQGGVRMFEKLRDKSERGECPLYRTKEHQANIRWRRKLGKRRNWSGSKSVLFVPASSKTIKETARVAVAKSKENIRVVENGGTSLKRILQRSNPYKPHECIDPGSCGVCCVKEGGQKGCVKNSCMTNNVGYVSTCVTC